MCQLSTQIIRSNATSGGHQLPTERTLTPYLQTPPLEQLYKRVMMLKIAGLLATGA